MDESTIILLDLNKTLARICTYTLNQVYDVSKDVYSEELVAKINGRRIFLITARLNSYEAETRKRIAETTNLQIERFYFKPVENKSLHVHFFKRDVVLELFKEGFKPADFFGIESNATTRAEYTKLGIKSVPRDVFLREELLGKRDNQ
jgi:hypothetical protein